LTNTEEPSYGTHVVPKPERDSSALYAPDG